MTICYFHKSTSNFKFYKMRKYVLGSKSKDATLADDSGHNGPKAYKEDYLPAYMSKMVDKPAEDTTMFNFENCLQV